MPYIEIASGSIETFQHPLEYNLNAVLEEDGECPKHEISSDCYHDDYDCTYEDGFYYWYCFPGCLPDSNPYGPFESIADVLADIGENHEDYLTEED